MITGHPFRVVRDGDGKLLLKWVRSAAAAHCAGCGDAIWPGEKKAVYDDVASAFPLPAHHTKRVYCEICGELLEDSLITTEAA